MRSRSISLNAWGAGPEPADHEFMRRLFRQWDGEHQKSLSLQNLVKGFAQVKATRDIMTNIAYFFDLYDDDGDGKVDRDGILKMSEAFLFLGRKGLDMPELKSPTSPKKTGDIEASKDEQFLSAVSSFIKRAFEYADPDSMANMTIQRQNTEDGTKTAPKPVEQFAIGDDSDEEEELVNLGETPKSPAKVKADHAGLTAEEILNLPPVPSESKPHTHAANAALDPAKPLFISLPTFRMVILADEVLESFFDTGFANTFHLADQPIPSSASSLSNLTTFANLGRPAVNTAQHPGIILPPNKGLRGMLDGIVNDGMRVAQEVRRRMEEAQRELDRASAAGAGAAREEDDEDDEEMDEKIPANDPERRSVLSSDRDLLDNAEAEEVGSGEAPATAMASVTLLDEPIDEAKGKGKGSNVVEFER
jgi:hypothetical protein